MDKRPLNIMHVTSNLNSGGVQHLLVKSMAIIDRERFNHTICCVSGGGVYEEELQQIGIPYWIMNRHARFDPSIPFQMARLMRQEQVDIVHCLNFTANFWGRIAAKIASVPYIIAHERGTGWTESAMMRFADRQLYRITDIWLANSAAAKQILIQRVGIPDERIRVIYNGLLVRNSTYYLHGQLRQQLAIDAETPLVGTIGRLDTPKGISFLLESIPLVWETNPETHFVIIGDGPLRTHLEAYAAKLNLFNDNKLHFFGFLADADAIIPDLTLLVHPAIREAFGNVLIEASVAKCPVIASNVDGCAEIIINGVTGILVENSIPVTFIVATGVSPLPHYVVDGRTRQLRPPLGIAPTVLAEAIVTLLREPDLCQKMSEAAHSRAVEMFSLKRFVSDLEDVYKSAGESILDRSSRT